MGNTMSNLASLAFALLGARHALREQLPKRYVVAFLVRASCSQRRAAYESRGRYSRS